MRIIGRCLGTLATGAAAVTIWIIGTTAAQAAPQFSEQDRTFLIQAHQSNLAEIAAGKLAQTRGTSQTVKDLGARFVADHTQLDQEVTQTASSLGIALPNTPNPQQQAVQSQLEAAPADAFDDQFVSTQLAGHEATMRNGETELKDGSSAQVKQLATNAAPIIQAHHAALQQAAAELGLATPTPLHS
jgi:putative membrane protein